jgi:hypothetical protein
MPFNPKSLKNLIPLKAGDPGRNPRGRALECLARQLFEEQDKDRLRQLLLKIYDRALNKDDNYAAALLFDRAYGKARSDIDSLEGNIQINIFSNVPRPEAINVSNPQYNAKLLPSSVASDVPLEQETVDSSEMP